MMYTLYMTSPVVEELREALAEKIQDTKFFEKDSNFLEAVGTPPTAELTEKITDFLKGEKRPGSVELMKVFTDTAVLDAELSLLAEGRFDPQKIEAAGLPIMLNTQATTPEMMNAGLVMLTEEAHTKLLGEINVLKYGLKQHITRTAQQVAEHYSEWLTREPTLAQKVKGFFGIKATSPYEIPFVVNEQENQMLQELSKQKYGSREEARSVYRSRILGIATKRPESIGLKYTADAEHRLETMANTMGNNASEPVDAGRLKMAHTIFKGPVMDELQIHQGFGEAIEQSVKRDLLERAEM